MQAGREGGGEQEELGVDEEDEDEEQVYRGPSRALREHGRRERMSRHEGGRGWMGRSLLGPWVGQ
eukprot:4853652-Pyramimonas_sp.AAC.1